MYIQFFFNVHFPNREKREFENKCKSGPTHIIKPQQIMKHFFKESLDPKKKKFQYFTKLATYYLSNYQQWECLQKPVREKVGVLSILSFADKLGQKISSKSCFFFSF